MRQAETLDQTVRRVLLANMRPALKAAIDGELAKGIAPNAILARVRGLTGGPQGRVLGGERKGAMTYLQVEAYLQSKGGLR